MLGLEINSKGIFSASLDINILKIAKKLIDQFFIQKLTNMIKKSKNIKCHFTCFHTLSEYILFYFQICIFS